MASKKLLAEFSCGSLADPVPFSFDLNEHRTGQTLKREIRRGIHAAYAAKTGTTCGSATTARSHDFLLPPSMQAGEFKRKGDEAFAPVIEFGLKEVRKTYSGPICRFSTPMEYRWLTDFIQGLWASMERRNAKREAKLVVKLREPKSTGITLDQLIASGRVTLPEKPNRHLRAL